MVVRKGSATNKQQGKKMEETLREGYVRVSDVLGQWSLMSSIPREILERKGEIGTKVHDAIRDFAECIPSVLTDDEGGQYYRSFLVWYGSEKPSFLDIETRLYDDELMVTGRIDATAMLHGNKNPVLVDWKTSYAANKIMWNLQANFYMYLLEKSGKNFHIGSRAVFVKLDKTGELPKLYEFEYNEQSIEVCRAATIAYREVKDLIIKKQKNETHIEREEV